MEANELRLGNLCEYFIQDNVEKDYWVKNKIDIQDLELCLKEKEYFNKLYQPIPLTPEILEKCGFYFEKHWYKRIANLDFFICSLGNMDEFYLLQFGSCGIMPPCKYLHQLQNLYFALTGEELTVNI
jgi:hypothetical protein